MEKSDLSGEVVAVTTTSCTIIPSCCIFPTMTHSCPYAACCVQECCLSKSLAAAAEAAAAEAAAAALAVRTVEPLEDPIQKTG